MPKITKVTAEQIAAIAKLAAENDDSAYFITSSIRGHGATDPIPMRDIHAILRFGNALCELASTLLFDQERHVQKAELELLKESRDAK